MIEQGGLKDLLEYSPETGLFHWLISQGNQKAGNVAGTNDHGYALVKINGKKYKAHRLAWLYMTGSFPKDCIDHVNGVTGDNRFSNLREATNSQNQYNKGTGKHNLLGVKGVRKTKIGRYEARATLSKNTLCLGTYDTAEEASRAYQEFAKKHHGEFYHG
tara:strand:+ start:835 stop:1314 length:480 start_codon:yes stop_codon:yes gene_type:complete